jgi:hypothetical protein
MTFAQATSPAVLPEVSTSAPPSTPYVGPASSSYVPRGSDSVRDSGMAMQSQSAQSRPQRYRNDPAAPTPSDSVTGGTHYLPDDVVELSAGSSSIYDFPRRIRRISIADTGVADLQVVNPFQINLVTRKDSPLSQSGILAANMWSGKFVSIRLDGSR